jgi:hypothetical protein
MRARVGGAFVAAVFALAVVGAGAPAPSRAAGEAYFSVVLHGVGSGTVQTLTSQSGTPDNQIDCRMVEGFVDPREVCGNQFYPTIGGTRYWYRVAPAANSCVQIAADCTYGYTTYFDLTPGADITKTITFNHASWTLTVIRSGAFGTSRITSADGFFTCYSSCDHAYPGGTVVKLTAIPDPSAHFVEWTGACAGQDETCDLTMLGNLTTTATFAAGPIETPGPTPTATPLVTPVASTKATPGTTIRPTSTPHATAAGLGTPTAAASGNPPTSDAPPSDGPSLEPSAPTGSIGQPSPADSAASSGGAVPSTAVVNPAGAAGGSDLTPIVLAILGAGLFIAIAIGFLGYRMTRRGTPPPPAA